MWFRSYHSLSYQLNNRSYPACTMQIVVVSETNIVSFLDLQWKWIAEKELRVTSALACVIIFLYTITLLWMFGQFSSSLHLPIVRIAFALTISDPRNRDYLFLVIVLIIKCPQAWLDIIFTGTHFILIIVHYYSELNVYWIKD